MHDLVVHDYGPARMMISLHAEVPGNMNIFELHDTIDNAEVDIASRFNCQVVIHMDPIDVENQRLAGLKTVVQQEITKINNELMAHDIRMVPGVTHTNLIFDVVKPFSFMPSIQTKGAARSLALFEFSILKCLIPYPRKVKSTIHKLL